MSRMKSRSTFAAILLVLASDAALASLSSASHPIFGSASMTKDSEQGLFWLTPTATVGLSFTEVGVLLATDTRFAGFRVANLTELDSLYVQAGIPDINVPGYGALYGTPENVPGVEFMQSLTGVTFFMHQGGQILAETAGFVGTAFTSPINGFSSVYIGGVVLRQDVPTSTGPMDFASAYTAWGSLPIGTQAEGVGTWLVSAVPEPASYALALTGLGALGFVTRRRKRTLG